MAVSDALIYQLYQALSSAGYTPKTEEEKQAEAARKASSAYEEKRLTAKQTQQAEDAELLRQLEAMREDYATRKAESAASYRNALSEQDRMALARGMQRSSYNGATLGNIALAGEAAREKLSAEESTAARGIEEKRGEAATKLAETLALYDTSEQSARQSYLDELNEQEQEKQSSAQKTYTELLEKLISYQQKAEAQAQEQQNWLKTYEAKYGKK